MMLTMFIIVVGVCLVTVRLVTRQLPSAFTSDEDPQSRTALQDAN